MWSVISCRLGSALCLDYENKILSKKLLRGGEKEVLVSLHVMSSF